MDMENWVDLSIRDEKQKFEKHLEDEFSEKYGVLLANDDFLYDDFIYSEDENAYIITYGKKGMNGKKIEIDFFIYRTYSKSHKIKNLLSPRYMNVFITIRDANGDKIASYRPPLDILIEMLKNDSKIDFTKLKDYGGFFNKRDEEIYKNEDDFFGR